MYRFIQRNNLLITTYEKDTYYLLAVRTVHVLYPDFRKESRNQEMTYEFFRGGGAAM